MTQHIQSNNENSIRFLELPIKATDKHCGDCSFQVEGSRGIACMVFDRLLERDSEENQSDVLHLDNLPFKRDERCLKSEENYKESKLSPVQKNILSAETSPKLCLNCGWEDWRVCEHCRSYSEWIPITHHT